MISISKDVYIDKLDQLVTKYASSYHVKIKMKPFDANSRMHFDFNRDNNRSGRKFKIANYVRI